MDLWTTEYAQLRVLLAIPTGNRYIVGARDCVADFEHAVHRGVIAKSFSGRVLRIRTPPSRPPVGILIF